MDTLFLPTFIIHNAYSALERNAYIYTDSNDMGHSTKAGRHSSAKLTKARKSKRRMSKRGK